MPLRLRPELFGILGMLGRLDAQRDELFDIRPQLLGLGQSRDDAARHLGLLLVVLVDPHGADQVRGHVPKEGLAVRGVAPQFAAVFSVSHDLFASFLRRSDTSRRVYPGGPAG